MTTKLRFDIDIQTMNWADLEDVQSGAFARIRPVMTRYMVSETGEKLKQEEADKIVLAISVLDSVDAAREFKHRFDDAFLNPTSGDSSKDQSPAAEETPPSGTDS